MKLAENMKIVPVAKALDVSSGATNAGDSINMKNFHHATFIVLTGTMGGADTHVKVNSGATAGAATSALTFNYAFGGAAVGTAVAGSTASCDVLAATASSADLSITHGTYDDWMLVVEVDASKMDIANGEEWLTISFDDDDGGATGTLDCVAILEPRYSSNRSITCLA